MLSRANSNAPWAARPSSCPADRSAASRIGVVTGARGQPGADLPPRKGVDTFITGEGPHWTGALAEELGVNIFYGGHYATETFGVKALAAELSKKFPSPVGVLRSSHRTVRANRLSIGQ
jgi:putative NIF3 family GTP cyclohydrolase 1 type 2